MSEEYYTSEENFTVEKKIQLGEVAAREAVSAVEVWYMENERYNYETNKMIPGAGNFLNRLYCSQLTPHICSAQVTSPNRRGSEVNASA